MTMMTSMFFSLSRVVVAESNRVVRGMFFYCFGQEFVAMNRISRRLKRTSFEIEAVRRAREVRGALGVVQVRVIIVVICSVL
jgi:hypothetical protein